MGDFFMHNPFITTSFFDFMSWIIIISIVIALLRMCGAKI